MYSLSRSYAFPVVWLAVLATGTALYRPAPAVDARASLSARIGQPPAAPDTPVFLSKTPFAQEIAFVSHDADEAESMALVTTRDFLGGHGRFAAPGNAVRRQVQLKAINPRTADELAGFFRDASYTLASIRAGEPVPPIKLTRVPDDLVNKDGGARKALFISALLPLVLEVNQRVLAERDQLFYLRDKLATPDGLSPMERIWLEQLAERYGTRIDNLDELVRRVDIVPPSMAIAQGGWESGWGTSFAARNGNALYGQIQAGGQHAVSVSWQPGAGMPQPFANVGEATEAYVSNLNTHPAYAAFRAERAALRKRGEPLEGYRLVGQLALYSELGQSYVGFVRQMIRENDLGDLDKAKLSSF